MKKKDFWKKLLVFSLILAFSIGMSACGTKADDITAEDDYIEEYEETEPEVGVEDENGWTRIDPNGDDYEVIFDSEKEDIAAILPGMVLGRYYKDDCEFIISKPVIPENLMYTLEQYKYNYVMVTQSGGDLNETYHENGGYALIICFPDTLEIRAYDHADPDRGGDGGKMANFEYVPNDKYIEGGESIAYESGYANTHDPVDLVDHETEFETLANLVENKANYY